MYLLIMFFLEDTEGSVLRLKTLAECWAERDRLFERHADKLVTIEIYSVNKVIGTYSNYTIPDM